MTARIFKTFKSFGLEGFILLIIYIIIFSKYSASSVNTTLATFFSPVFQFSPYFLNRTGSAILHCLIKVNNIQFLYHFSVLIFPDKLEVIYITHFNRTGYISITKWVSFIFVDGWVSVTSTFTEPMTVLTKSCGFP